MAFEGASKIWMNGKMVPWDDAKIHVCSHVVHYGSAVFEGARVYNTPKGPAAFRLREHVQRLLDSAKIYRMDPGYSVDELARACLETVRANGLEECYLRPIIYRGYNALGVNPGKCPVDTAVAVWKWGAYLGAEALEQGVDVTVSTWTRMAPNTLPAMAKSAANYMNSQLINIEAKTRGFNEGIALTAAGNVSEGSGENIFVVWRGKLITPPLSDSILPGITRDSVMTIAADLGYTVQEQSIPREMLYVADEVFFTGSAAEVTPIRSVDHVQVGIGRRGPVTKAVQEAYFAAVKGESNAHPEWLTLING